MKKPKMVMFYPHVVKSFDALGEEIPELSGPYSPELKSAIDVAADESTKYTDITTSRLLHEAADRTNDAADHDELHAAAVVAGEDWGLLAPEGRHYIQRWLDGLFQRYGLSS